MVRKEIRDQVLAKIISVMAEGEELGQEAWKYAESKLPGIPGDVMTEAWVEFEGRKTEAWWQAVEKTIDAEVIGKAISAATAKS